MNIVVGLIAVMAWIVTVRRYGFWSFPTIGLFGLTTYSVPIFMGARILFTYEGLNQNFLAPVSLEATFVYLTAWLVVFFVNSAPILRFPRSIRGEDIYVHHTKITDFFRANFFIFIFGYLYLSSLSGPLFFLQPRDDQHLGLIPLLWKWTVPFMLITAVLIKRRSYVVISLICLSIIFLRGDRTILVIGGMIGFFISQKPSTTLLKAIRLRYVISMLILAFLVFLGKPIYTIIKSRNLRDLENLLNFDVLLNALWNFEPMGTISHLETSISTGFNISMGDFLVSVLGNLLIIPSAFGFETNLYNVRFTQVLPYELSFGIAGNFWAHAWSVGGIPMVIGFAFLYSFSLIQLQRMFFKSRGTGKVWAALAAGIIGVYAHRNGLDNLLSFIRQISVLYVLCNATTPLIKLMPRKTRKKIFSMSDAEMVCERQQKMRITHGAAE